MGGWVAGPWLRRTCSNNCSMASLWARFLIIRYLPWSVNYADPMKCHCQRLCSGENKAQAGHSDQEPLEGEEQGPCLSAVSRALLREGKWPQAETTVDYKRSQQLQVGRRHWPPHHVASMSYGKKRNATLRPHFSFRKGFIAGIPWKGILYLIKSCFSEVLWTILQTPEEEVKNSGS